MKILRYGLIITSCLFLAACDDSVEGTITLQQPITLKMGKNPDLVIPMGSQWAKVTAASSKLKLKVKINGKDQEAIFSVPSGKKIKSISDVNLLASESGQPYNIKGQEDTSYQDSSPVRSSESCSFNTSENVCGYETSPRTCHNEQSCGLQPDGTQACHDVPVCTGGESQYICRNRIVTHSGSQDVEYYMTYATTDRRVDLIDPNSQQNIGAFTNQSTESTKHYTFQSQCYEGRF